jgi:hypothetical protein
MEELVQQLANVLMPQRCGGHKKHNGPTAVRETFYGASQQQGDDSW